MSRYKTNQSVYVIAEIGVNHNGEIDIAKALIKAAVESGADAVKFQLRDLEEIYTKEVLKDPLKAEHGTQYLLQKIRESLLTQESILELKNYTEKNFDADFFATPFDIKSAQFLNEIGVELFKIGSPDFTNLPLIKAITEFGKPLILSTGMSDQDQIKKMVGYLDTWQADYALLHCNSTYPASVQDINLKYLPVMKSLTKNKVGYSGHEQGFLPSLAAVALGAEIIERHITFDKGAEGPDHSASLTPLEFKEMVRSIREVESSLGVARRFANQGEINNKLALSKSLVYASAFSKGSVLSYASFLAKTPAKGIDPLEIDDFIGKTLLKDVAEESYAQYDDIKTSTVKEEFSIPKTWGIVGRLNDFQEFLHMKPDLVEIHLTWRDLVNFNAKDFLAEKHNFSCDLIVHAPEYYHDQLIDFSTTDQKITETSIEMLRKVVDLTHSIAPSFKGVDQKLGPRIVLHPGGHFQDQAVMQTSNKNEQYANMLNNLKNVKSDGARILIENMPPFPWYFGGQWYNTIFMNPKEISQFLQELGWGTCYDLSHALLYCNSVGMKLEDFTKTILPQISYLHISDAAGTTQEGLQLGQGNLSFEHLSYILNAIDVGFIPEIWKGHLNKGEGFKRALTTIEELLKNKYAGKSCLDGTCGHPEHKKLP